MKPSLCDIEESALELVMKDTCLTVIQFVRTKSLSICQVYKPLGITKASLAEIVFKRYPSFFHTKTAIDSSNYPYDELSVTMDGLDFYIKNSTPKLK